MAVVATDVLYLQTTETDSLGGAIGITPVPTGLNLFFGSVDEQEATSGSTAYRCFYVKNENDVDTFSAVVIYIAGLTPSPSTHCEIGLGTAGLNGTEQTISGENIAPVGVVFTAATETVPLVIGDLGPNEYYPVWIKRVVQPEAVGASSDTVVLAVKGDGG